MGRIANKKTTPAYIKMLVIKSNSLDDLVKNTGLHAKDEKYSSLDLVKLWNRRSAFRRDIKTIESDLKKNAVKDIKVAKAKVLVKPTKVKKSRAAAKVSASTYNVEAEVAKIKDSIIRLNELFAQLIVAVRIRQASKPIK